MSIEICTDNTIRLDGVNTKLKLTQAREGTLVYSPERVDGQKYAEHKMPHARYSTAHDAPDSGAAGRSQLEADIRILIERLA
jgi:hypothetical protein